MKQKIIRNILRSIQNSPAVLSVSYNLDEQKLSSREALHMKYIDFIKSNGLSTLLKFKLYQILNQPVKI